LSVFKEVINLSARKYVYMKRFNIQESVSNASQATKRSIYNLFLLKRMANFAA